MTRLGADPLVASLVAVVTLLVATSSASPAAPLPASPALSWACPASLPLRSLPLAVDGVPPGARASLAAGPVALSGVSAFDGPPEEGAALRPSGSFNGGHLLRWDWADAPLSTAWLSCDYAGGLVHLAWPVAQALRACTATRTVRATSQGKAKSGQLSWRCDPTP
jgi:hypothetical protein